MHVEVAKTHVIEALRQRAKPFETHVSNPASGAAHRQLTDQIELLEKTPGDSVADVQQTLRAHAKDAERARNKNAMIAGGLFVGLATSLAICGGPSSNGWIQGFNLISLFAGATNTLWAVGHEETRQGWDGQARSLDNLAPTATASDTGNLRGTPTVSLAGPPSLTQLRDLLTATQESLQNMPQPEFEAARKQVKNDLSNLKSYQGPTLEEARQQAESRDQKALKVLNLAPWGLGAGILSIFLADHFAPGLALVGGGLILATFASTVGSAFARGKANEAKQTLACWEPQLQALRDIDSAGQEMREWGKQKGPAVVQQEHSVVVGGIRIPVRRKA